MKSHFNETLSLTGLQQLYPYLTSLNSRGDALLLYMYICRIAYDDLLMHSLMHGESDLDSKMEIILP